MTARRVCAVGPSTSELAAAYLGHLPGGTSTEATDGGSPSSLIACDRGTLIRALGQVNVHISHNQAAQLLAACRSRQDAFPEPDTPLLTWAEFCVVCTELRALKSRKASPQPLQASCHRADQKAPPPRPPPPPPPPPRDKEKGCQCSVFLGGSCNPTTWRKDVAIPSFVEAGISYYNPQVEEWYPELIEVEAEARKGAALLFFVIDNCTRAVSSMVEIAYLVGGGRDTVVTVEDVCNTGRISGDALSEREVEDLNRGRAFVRCLVEQSGDAVLERSLDTAIATAIKVLKNEASLSSLKPHPHWEGKPRSWPRPLGEELLLLQQVFTMFDSERSGQLDWSQAELALKSLEIEIPSTLDVLLKEMGSHDLASSWKQHGMSFEEFGVLYTELKLSSLLTQSKQQPGPLWAAIRSLLLPLRWLSGMLWYPSSSSSAGDDPDVAAAAAQCGVGGCDVFLGGSCGATSWRSEEAVPLLRKHAVSYFNPQVVQWDARLIPVEQDAKDRCGLLLFVISGETLSVASMVEAAYYIGCGRKVVLCLSDITPGAEVEGMKLSVRAVKDYNRGRAYLSSIASKSEVTVFSSLSDALGCVVSSVRGEGGASAAPPPSSHGNDSEGTAV